LKDRKVKGKIESSCSVALKNKMMNPSKMLLINIAAKVVPVKFLFAMVVTIEAKSSSFYFQNLLKATS